MNPTNLQQYFILDIVTHRSRQTARFWLDTPINFARLNEDEKLAFTCAAVESSGMQVDDEAEIEVLAFSSRDLCNEEFDKIRRDQPSHRAGGLH